MSLNASAVGLLHVAQLLPGDHRGRLRGGERQLRSAALHAELLLGFVFDARLGGAVIDMFFWLRMLIITSNKNG